MESSRNAPQTIVPNSPMPFTFGVHSITLFQYEYLFLKSYSGRIRICWYSIHLGPSCACKMIMPGVTRSSAG